ncbi:MAG: UbiD family decarboxylase [Chloroflexota bacterium]
MAFNDLREFIKKAEEIGECQRIEGADWESDIGTLTELLSEQPDPKLLLFDNIKGYPPGFRVASNLFASHRRTAMCLGLPEEAKGVELVRAFRDKLRGGIKPIPPVEVKKAPVKENILTGDQVDLFKFPVPKWHERDGGRYIGTGDIVITRDPDEGWVNFGTYRVQAVDKTTAVPMIAGGHHGNMIRKKYWERGRACPAVICCGQEPLLYSASSWEHVPWGVSEYDFTGGLRGSPVSVTKGVTTDLPIPATAELALEGELLPPEVDSRMEGPFGEWPGYYSAPETLRPAFRIKAILHRNDPIIQGNPASRFPAVWTLGRHFQKAAVLWDELDKHIPGVRGVRMLEDAAMHSVVIISLKQEYDGQAKQAAAIAVGCNATALCLRFVIVVDDDIDPFDTSQVLWALGTRCEPEDAIEVLRGCWTGETDPLLSPEKRRLGIINHSVGIIFACKPYSWIKEFPTPIKSSPELVAQTKKRWGHLFPQG